MEEFRVNKIGLASIEEDSFKIKIDAAYRLGLKSLENGIYIQILWWFHQSDQQDQRTQLVENTPYNKGPKELGVFATRSPHRPNPLGLTVAKIKAVDIEEGVIIVNYFDCFDKTPILDIKPYIPSFDRVEDPQVPSWSEEWPSSYETSSSFDWSRVFNDE